MARLRNAAGEYADVLFYRATAFCKLYEQTGCVRDRWQDLAAFVRWPGQPAELRDLFRACGLVISERDALYDWDLLNGWIIDRAERERKRAAKNRAAEAAKEARKEGIAAQRRKVAQSGRKEGRKEGGGYAPRTVRVRNSGPKTRNQKGK
jgi:flagellar biosynthesis/type III secretory pathway protein FliH